MAEYITKERVIEWFRPYGHTEEGIPFSTLKTDVMGMPAADVAPVVRCKDCRYFDKAAPNDKGFCICPASGMEIVPDDFCSYGERKIEC